MGIAHRCSKCADTRFWSHLKNDADMVFRCEVATVGEGQKKFRLAPDTVVRRMLHFAVIWVTVFPKVGYFA